LVFLPMTSQYFESSSKSFRLNTNVFRAWGSLRQLAAADLLSFSDCLLQFRVRRSSTELQEARPSKL
jgi:hypothetical protein